MNNESPNKKRYQEDVDEEVKPQQVSLTAYAFIKYTALIIIVLAILYFLAVYVLPVIREAIRSMLTWAGV